MTRTYLIGNNGAGKTTLGLNAIWFIFQGIAERGSGNINPFLAERFRFIGDSGRSAKGEMTLVDEKIGVEIKVIRKLTKDGTQLSFEAPQGMVLDQAWLNRLFNVFLIAPRTFVELDSSKQSEVLGINTSKFDAEMAALKSDFTLINRDLKSLGDIAKVEEVEPIDIAELIAEKNKIIAYNDIQTNLENDLKRSEEKKQSLEKQILELQGKLSIVVEAMGIIQKPKAKISTDKIDERITSVNENNTKVNLYQNYLTQKAVHDQKTKELADNKEKQSDLYEKRIEYIRSKKLPFPELSTNENGELMLNDKPIKEAYFSMGELLKIVPVLISSLNPELKYVFIQQFNLLDEHKQKEIMDYLIGRGFQVVAEVVGEKEIKDKYCLVLREMKLVGKSEKKGELI